MNKWMIWGVFRFSHIFGSTPVSWCIKLQKRPAVVDIGKWYPPNASKGRHWSFAMEGLGEKATSSPIRGLHFTGSKLSASCTFKPLECLCIWFTRTSSKQDEAENSLWSRILHSVCVCENCEERLKGPSATKLLLYPIQYSVVVYYSMKVPSTSSFFKKTWRFDHLQISAICLKLWSWSRIPTILESLGILPDSAVFARENMGKDACNKLACNRRGWMMLGKWNSSNSPNCKWKVFKLRCIYVCSVPLQSTIKTCNVPPVAGHLLLRVLEPGRNTSAFIPPSPWQRPTLDRWHNIQSSHQD